MNENDYKEVIARYTYEQLVYEMAIVNEEENLVYIKKKALKEEFKNRLRSDKNGIRV